MAIVIFILILFAIGYYHDSSTNSSPGPTVNTNTITYPADIKCQCCEEPIRPTMQTIDTSTWDLICPKCKKIAYMHPKRKERQEQLDWLLDQCE